jgi:hypothetical protein
LIVNVIQNIPINVNPLCTRGWTVIKSPAALSAWKLIAKISPPALRRSWNESDSRWAWRNRSLRKLRMIPCSSFVCA